MTVLGSVLAQASKQARRALHRSDARRAGVALAVAVTCTALHGCAGDDPAPTGASTGALTSYNGVTYWTTNQNKVPICFYMDYVGKEDPPTVSVED